MAIFARGMFIAGVGLLAAQVHAQPYARPGEVFVCASSGYQQNYCEADTRYGVTMTRQISNSACIQSRTWGYDRRGVWVTQGCKAEFMLGQRMPPPMPVQIVRCESNDYRQNFCRVDTRGGVRLQRQISNSACIRGRTWGANGNGIWVGDGCQGDFAVGNGWDPGAPPPPSVFMPERMVRCESINGRTVRCDVDTRGGVSLATQLSSSACLQSRTWGWDRNGVWVSNGCRADFRIGGWYR